MAASDIIAGLLDPSPCFLCQNLRGRDPDARYRVPVVHQSLGAFHLEEPDPEAGAQALAELPDIQSARQLRAVLEDNLGLGLWVPRHLAMGREAKTRQPASQLAAGSLLIFPPAEWDSLQMEFEDWQFDGVEAAFEDLPYTSDEVIPFAGPNFSPDRWLLVLDGPMAGNVCWWTHDGDSVMDIPWAKDIKSWADRVFAEAPDVFGGVIRFTAEDSIDPVPANADLFPHEYRREMPEKV